MHRFASADPVWPVKSQLKWLTKFPIRLRQQHNSNDKLDNRQKKQTTHIRTDVEKWLQLSDDSIHVGCIKVLDESPHKGHLVSSIVKHCLRVHHSAAETVGGHDHWQIVHIHFVQHNVFRSGEYLFIQQANRGTWHKTTKHRSEKTACASSTSFSKTVSQ